jgi:transcriptional regulator with XRE-family HTH domain
MSKERAIQLRLEGKSLSQIAETLGRRSAGGSLSRWLKDVQPPEWTRRPNAKDGLRALAVDLRRRGRTYGEIAEELKVSKSSLSLWLRDVVVNPDDAARLTEAQQRGQKKGASARRAIREARERQIMSAASAEMPAALCERELFFAGLALYWAEGAKAKAWNPSAQVCLVNSDPDVIRVFLAWLALVGVDEESIAFRVAIHHTGDVARAERFWADVVGISTSDLLRTSLKTHERRPAQRLPTEDYVGCLRVEVRRSTDFNRQIAGWWQGLVAAIASL